GWRLRTPRAGAITTHARAGRGRRSGRRRETDGSGGYGCRSGRRCRRCMTTWSPPVPATPAAKPRRRPLVRAPADAGQPLDDLRLARHSRASRGVTTRVAAALDGTGVAGWIPRGLLAT